MLTLQSGKRRVLVQQHERNKIQSGVFRAYVTDVTFNGSINKIKKKLSQNCDQE